MILWNHHRDKTVQTAKPIVRSLKPASDVAHVL